MDASVQDVLENRIAELEKKLFGLEGKPNAQYLMPENTVIESLAHLNTLISSALFGREKINALIERLPELESYIQSDFEPVDLQTDMKCEYILAMEPEIRHKCKQLERLKELLPVLESDQLSNLPEMSTELDNLSLKYIKISEETEKLNKDARNMISRYNDIITNISKTLITLDSEVTELEKAAEPKKLCIHPYVLKECSVAADVHGNCKIATAILLKLLILYKPLSTI